MSRAFRCRYCPDRPDRLPDWRLERRGDAVVEWSCDTHLPGVAEMMQRSGERTELVLKQSNIQEVDR